MQKINDQREHLWFNPSHTWEDHHKRRRLKDIKKIVIHHTANNINDIKIANELEIANKVASPLGFPRLRYHYFINEYADVFQANDLEDITWHARLADKSSVAIGVVGDYDKQEPRRPVLEALEELLSKLLTELGLQKKDVAGHGELWLYLNFTSCPGKNLLPYIKKYRQTGQMV